jgi:LIM domain.
MAPRCVQTTSSYTIPKKVLEIETIEKEFVTTKYQCKNTNKEEIDTKKSDLDRASDNLKKEHIHRYPTISQAISYAASVPPSHKRYVGRKQPYPASEYFVLPVTNKRSKSGRLKLCVDEPVPCTHCKKKIESKYLLYALDSYWHEKCLKCDFCRKPLHKFGSKFYCRQGAKFCQDDFVRLVIKLFVF